MTLAIHLEETMEHADRFLDRVIRFWAAPDPARVQSFFHPEATIRWLPTLREPMSPARLERLFERVTLALPDLHIECRRWAARGEVLFAETRITATLGGQPLALSTIDLFVLRGDRAIEQVAYFDDVPLRALVDPSIVLGEAE